MLPFLLVLNFTRVATDSVICSYLGSLPYKQRTYIYQNSHIKRPNYLFQSNESVSPLMPFDVKN